jgi:uncharacterized membrane protein HdeD (DUF308 family)
LLLGLVVIFVPAISQIRVSALIGWILVAAGIAGITSLSAGRHYPGSQWAAISALLSVGLGYVLVRWQGEVVISYSLVLAGFFIIDGILTILFAVEHRLRLTGSWRWLFANGLLDFLLAATIFIFQPHLTIWLFSIMVSLDLIFAGWSLIALSLAAEAATKAPQVEGR